MALTQHSLDVAFYQGKERGLAGAGYVENPHKGDLGTPGRALAVAWLQGRLEGLGIRLAQT